MVGTGADAGKVRVRFFDGAFTLTTATLAVDQIFVSFSRGLEGYANGAVWLNTNGTNTGTVPGIDGTASNPVSTMAAVNTLLTKTNLSRIEVGPASSVTFAAAQENQIFHGENWTLALGGQSISNSYIYGASVSGIATGAASFTFDYCRMGLCTLAPGHLDRCDLEDVITLSGAGEYSFVDCAHASGSAVTDFGAAVANTTVHVHGWKGGLTIKNMGQSGTDVLHFDSAGGKLTLDSTNTGGTKNLNGTFALVDNSTGQTTNGDGDAITKIDGVKTKTDQMVFTKTNELDSNAKSINDAEVIGDGNATPWDGA